MNLPAAVLKQNPMLVSKQHVLRVKHARAKWVCFFKNSMYFGTLIEVYVPLPFQVGLVNFGLKRYVLFSVCLSNYHYYSLDGSIA